MDRNSKIYSKLAFSKVITGSTLVVGKLVVANFPVFLVSGLRLAIASAVLVPLLIKQSGRLTSIPRRDLVILFMQAFLGVFLFSIALLYGLKLTTATESGVITSATPAIVGLVSFMFLKERLNWHKGAGIMLSVVGILAINVLGPSAGIVRGSNPLLGNLLIFAAVIGEALFITLGKVASEEVTPLTITALVSFFGFLLFLPFSIYEASSFNFAATSPTDWVAILYYGIIGTAFSLVIWHEGVSQVQASTAAVFTSFIPISAVLFSYLILREPFGWSHFVGIMLVLMGIAFMSRTTPDEGRLTEELS